MRVGGPSRSNVQVIQCFLTVLHLNWERSGWRGRHLMPAMTAPTVGTADSPAHGAAARLGTLRFASRFTAGAKPQGFLSCTAMFRLRPYKINIFQQEIKILE